MTHVELTEALVEEGWTIRSGSDCGVIAARGDHERIHATRRFGSPMWSVLLQYAGGGHGFIADNTDDLRHRMAVAYPAEVGA